MTSTPHKRFSPALIYCIINLILLGIHFQPYLGTFPFSTLACQHSGHISGTSGPWGRHARRNERLKDRASAKTPRTSESCKTSLSQHQAECCLSGREIQPGDLRTRGRRPWLGAGLKLIMLDKDQKLSTFSFRFFRLIFFVFVGPQPEPAPRQRGGDIGVPAHRHQPAEDGKSERLSRHYIAGKKSLSQDLSQQMLKFLEEDGPVLNCYHGPADTRPELSPPARGGRGRKVLLRNA